MALLAKTSTEAVGVSLIYRFACFSAIIDGRHSRALFFRDHKIRRQTRKPPNNFIYVIAVRKEGLKFRYLVLSLKWKRFALRFFESKKKHPENSRRRIFAEKVISIKGYIMCVLFLPLRWQPKPETFGWIKHHDMLCKALLNYERRRNEFLFS